MAKRKQSAEIRVLADCRPGDVVTLAAAAPRSPRDEGELAVGTRAKVAWTSLAFGDRKPTPPTYAALEVWDAWEERFVERVTMVYADTPVTDVERRGYGKIDDGKGRHEDDADPLRRDKGGLF